MRVFIILVLFASLGMAVSGMARADTPELSGQKVSSAPDEIGVIKNGIRHVSPHEAAKLLAANPTMKVLDVRTRGEYNRGHIEGAVQINYFAFGFKKKLAALDKDTTWLVHCKSGHRSGRTLPLMKKAGFTSIIHMDGGFDSWKKADLPVALSGE